MSSFVEKIEQLLNYLEKGYKETCPDNKIFYAWALYRTLYLLYDYAVEPRSVVEHVHTLSSSLKNCVAKGIPEDLLAEFEYLNYSEFRSNTELYDYVDYLIERIQFFEYILRNSNVSPDTQRILNYLCDPYGLINMLEYYDTEDTPDPVYNMLYCIVRELRESDFDERHTEFTHKIVTVFRDMAPYVLQLIMFVDTAMAAIHYYKEKVWFHERNAGPVSSLGPDDDYVLKPYTRFSKLIPCDALPEHLWTSDPLYAVVEWSGKNAQYIETHKITDYFIDREKTDWKEAIYNISFLRY